MKDISLDQGLVITMACLLIPKKNVQPCLRAFKALVDNGVRLTVHLSTATARSNRRSPATSSRGVELDFDVCSNPEFLKEGAAIDDFTRGARIVVGTDSDKVRELMRECYGPYNWNHDKLIFMDVRFAELTKYEPSAVNAAGLLYFRVGRGDMVKLQRPG